MEYTLKDYQAEAVRDVLDNLRKARNFYQSEGDLSSFSLSATTGAGKTVMAAAVIEALFFGSDEFNFLADPGAVVLWFSDSPDLNEQSRARLHSASSELDSRLRVIESTFSEQQFRPQHVYFLNMQKLSKNSRLVRGHTDSGFPGQLELDGAFPGQVSIDMPRPDDVQSTIYDVITNTIENDDLTLYFVLDEAHRGMATKTKDRATIVQRLINGHGSVPAIPIVFGISATVERFDDAMREAKDRTTLPAVQVDSQLVQSSGLLKDDIVLDIPAEAGTYDTTLLTRAVRKIKASTAAWEQYAKGQGEGPVVPLLVVQVGDKPSEEELQRTLDTIYAEWPELPVDAVANVFGEHQNLTVGQEIVPYIEPQRVQDATHIRVLLAKSAISTGWDCPRAEVLVSFRPATDKTHITQLLGRMMRTPLARRIPGNELLNSVDCVLPLFDKKTATGVATMLMRGATAKDDDDDGTGGGEGRRVLFDPVELFPNSVISQDVWECFAELPTVTIPNKHVKPIRRLTILATALSKDGLVEGAVEKAHTRMHKALDGLRVEHDDKVAAAREDVLTMRGEETRARMGKGISYKSFTETADTRAIDDSYRVAARVFSPSVCSSYVDHLVGVDGDEDDLLEARIKVAALGKVVEIGTALEHKADEIARGWLNNTRVARKALPDEGQAEYDRLEGQSTQPERISLVEPVAAQADTMVRHPDGTEEKLPWWETHLLSTDEGMYPADLNGWEQKVLKQEMEHPGFKGWYRNPSRGVKESLAIAYKDGSGDWKAMRPDFIFFTPMHDGTVVADLVDPHGYHLSDALPKLRGWVDYAEKFSDEFRRIESVAEINGEMKVLDLTKPAIRDAIREATDAKSLYDSSLASPY